MFKILVYIRYMKKTFFIISFVWVFFTTNCFAQQSEYRHNIDSLSKLLLIDKQDTSKVKHLFKLARNYSYLYNFDSTMYYGNWSLRLNDSLFKVSTNNHKIITSLQKAKGVCHNIIGNACYDHGDYPKALENLFISLKLFEAANNKYNIAVALNTIGLIYYYQGNYDEALKNHLSVLKIYEALGDKSGMAMSYNNIAIVYDDQKKSDEALQYHLASLKIKLELKDKSGIATSYNNIGLVYSKKGNLEEAMNNYKACIQIYEELEDPEGKALAYFNIGEILVKEKKYVGAEKSFLKSKSLSLESHYRVNLKFTYQSLSSLYEAKGEYKKALENHKLYIDYRDSLVNEETKEQTLQQQMTYDFEKKEAVAKAEHQKEIENQKVLSDEKSRKQNLVIVFVAIGLILVLIFAAFIFRSLRVTRKQKHIIEHQKHVVEEHQKEIIDSITYAKRLQQAILPSTEEINKYLPEHFILYKPKDIVAGDFYWLHVVNDLIFIAAADSTGHGVPGAMVSVVCSNALNRAVDEFHLTDTGKILDKTRELVLETFAKSGEEIKDGMDISLLCIHQAKMEVTWSGANNPLWYITNSADSSSDEGSTLIEIKANKQAIGRTENPSPFTKHTLQLNSGDIFYLMTDGYADQFGGPKGKKYKYKALEELVLANCRLPLAYQNTELLKSFSNWKGNLEQVDDVTIIGIRV